MKCVKGKAAIGRNVSRPARGAWVEMLSEAAAAKKSKSRPARGAWVEILHHRQRPDRPVVAPRKGRVG